jgi:hypothetical protein
MTSINILKFGVSSPADTSSMKELKGAGYDAKDILGVVGKSEGMKLSHFCVTPLTIQGMAASTTSHEHSALMFGNRSSQSQQSRYFLVAQRESSVPM